MEKIITSKLLKPEANKRIATVDKNVGVVRDARLASNAFKADRTGRLVQASFRMVDILSPEPATKPHHGGQRTKALFQWHRSLAD
jgi:hypothetical protein